MRWVTTLACGMIVFKTDNTFAAAEANHGGRMEKIVTATWITTLGPTSGLIVM